MVSSAPFEEIVIGKAISILEHSLDVDDMQSETSSLIAALL